MRVVTSVSSISTCWDQICGEQVVDDAERLNKVQTEFFDLPNEAKDEFGRDKVDPLYSYRYRELETLDENGQPGRVESYNVGALSLDQRSELNLTIM